MGYEPTAVVFQERNPELVERLNTEFLPETVPAYSACAERIQLDAMLESWLNRRLRW